MEREGKFLKNQALETYNNPEVEFVIEGDLDYELIYIDMGNQEIPLGNYAKTLNPNHFYTNDFYLYPIAGQVAQFFNRKLKYARTSPPVFGLGALLSSFTDEQAKLAKDVERIMRYTRLTLAPFMGDYGRYVFNMYRAQASKHVMLEGGIHERALGVKLDGPLFNIAAKTGLDAILTELRSESEAGLFNEHTLLPQIVPLQIVIVGNVALVNVPGEPSNISGQRIERIVAGHFEERNIRKVIVNGYCNENTGYIFTPEEYPNQEAPRQCGFVLYGKWTEPRIPI